MWHDYCKFDLASAVYWWLADNHSGQWSQEYVLLCKIDSIYSPGMIENGPDEMAKDLYGCLTTGDCADIIDYLMQD